MSSGPRAVGGRNEEDVNTDSIITESKSEEAAQHAAHKISDLGLNPSPVFPPCVASERQNFPPASTQDGLPPGLPLEGEKEREGK